MMIYQLSDMCNPELGDISANVDVPIFVTENTIEAVKAIASSARVFDHMELQWKEPSQDWSAATITTGPSERTWGTPTTPGTYDRRTLIHYSDSHQPNPETVEDVFRVYESGKEPGTVALNYGTDGSISAIVRWDIELGRSGTFPSTELDLTPDPDSATPGATTGPIGGDDVIARIEQKAEPGDYIAIPRARHADGSEVEGGPIKISIPFYEVWDGSTLLSRDATAIASANNWVDLRFSPHPSSLIQGLTIADSGTTDSAIGSPPIGSGTDQDWRARTYSGAAGETRSAIAAITFTTHTEEFRYFVSVLSLPTETPLVEGVSNGEVIEWGSTVKLIAAPHDETRTLNSVDLRAVEYNNHQDLNVTQELSKSSYSGSDFINGNVAGVGTISREFTGYGYFGVEQVFHYSDGDVAKRTLFSNPQPTDEPFETTFTIYNPTLYEDSALSAFTYADHRHTVTAQELLVNGVSYPMDASMVGGKLQSLQLPDVGMSTPGVYSLQWKVTLSDTIPTESLSGITTVTVQAIPASDRLDTAIGDSGDNANWQAVIDAPDSTNQQKAIAQDMIALNNEISSGVDFGVPLSEVTNDRDNYLAELAAGTTGKTFTAWLDQQANITDPIEQQEARDFVLNAPTSSVNALLNYFNAQTHPYGSLIRLILGGIPGFSSGDWTFIRDNSQSFGGTVPDAVVLADYRQYAAEMQNVLVIPFERWV